MRIIWHTGRWKLIGSEHLDALHDSNSPYILCFWHGRLLMMPYSWQHHTAFFMLISGHRDGEMIADTIRRHGINHIKGSSSKGGMRAMRAMLKELKAGNCIGITPDGPRGPRMRASDGVISVARLSGAAILPVTYSASPAKIINSWDRFMVPLPFCRGELRYGPPVYVPRDADGADLDDRRQKLETILTGLSIEADRSMGHTPVQPAHENWGGAA